MSKSLSLLKYLTLGFFTNILCVSTVVVGQGNPDMIVFTRGNFPDGEGINMNIGDTLEFFYPVENLSFIKFNPDAALIVKAIGPVSTDVEHWQGLYSDMFFYSDEMKRSGIVGTDQYTKIPIRVVCINKKLPQPATYTPIDRRNVHPDASPFSYEVSDKEMLFLKRAFIWENAEDLRCDLDPFGPYSPHGPAGDVKLVVCDKSAANYSIDSLNYFQHLWDISNPMGCMVHVNYNGRLPPLIKTDCQSRLIEFRPQQFFDFFGIDFRIPIDTTIYLPRTSYHSNTIFGPIYISPSACEAADVAFGPVAHNEWTDGPWGAVYSNIAVVDWDQIDADEVAIVVVEADKPFDAVVASSDNLADVMGVFKVRKNEKSDILANLGMSGWLLLKNEKTDGNAVDLLPHYWYPTWNGDYPELTLGPAGKIKHFEDDNYACYEIENDCGPVLNELKSKSVIRRVNIDTSSIRPDTFYTYLYDPFMPPVYPCIFTYFGIDTNYMDFVESDSLIHIRKDVNTITNYCVIKDTIVLTPRDLYRRWGSQYQPYYSIEQIDRYVHDGDSIGVINGVIPADILLNKPLTFLPLDPQFKEEKKVLDQYPNFPVSEINLKRTPKHPSEVHEKVFIHPNPAQDNLFIRLNILEESALQIFLSNSMGQLVKTVIASNTLYFGEANFSVSLRDLPNGMYFITVKTSLGIQTSKFFKGN